MAVTNSVREKHLSHLSCDPKKAGEISPLLPFPPLKSKEWLVPRWQGSLGTWQVKGCAHPSKTPVRDVPICSPTQFSPLAARCWAPSLRHCFRTFYLCSLFNPQRSLHPVLLYRVEEGRLEVKDSFDFSDNFPYVCIFSHSVFLHIKRFSCRWETKSPWS